MLPPFNVAQWAEENKDKLSPPVGNVVVFNGEFKVMIVGGPNRRSDYHINMGEELFFQLKGEVVLKTVQNGQFVDIPIREGEMFLLPPSIPHSPQRGPETVGIVVERQRKPDEKDGLRWYCEKCHSICHEEYFACTDLGKQIREVVERYYESEDLRTCPKCHHVNPVPPKG